jgi:hypothetical protein
MAGKCFADEPVGAQLDRADFFEDFAGSHFFASEFAKYECGKIGNGVLPR